MRLARRLSIVPLSPFFNREECARVDKVFVDGVHLPNCVAYDVDAGWAFNQVDGIWEPKVHGAVRVTEKQGAVA